MHFYHENIIRHTNCPFRDFEEMNKGLIRNWNRQVNPQDEVYILGDVKRTCPGDGNAGPTKRTQISDTRES